VQVLVRHGSPLVAPHDLGAGRCRSPRLPRKEGEVSKLVLIRARLTDSEWKRIRTLAIKRDTTTADLVADTLRDALLKGAKP
jgi:hypothetical protein